MIPAGRINPRRAGDLMEYLRFEISNAESQRRPLEEKWIRYQRAYRCIPDVAQRDFPFLGAANFVVPIAATDIDTVFSRIMGILMGPENLWSVRPLRDDMIQFAARLQEFLQWAQHNEIKLYDAVADWVMEICKLGTSVLKQRYKRESKRVYQFRESDFGTLEEHALLLIHDHPTVEYVSIFDFLLPAIAKDIQNSPWAAERVGLTWGQLLNRINSGLYTGGDRLAGWRGRGDQGSLGLQAMQRNDNYVPSLPDRFDLWEGWLDFDITGVDGPEALVCTVHLPSMTYLRIDYNPYFNQEKPYSAARYLRQEGRFLGIGLSEMLDQTQEEVTTIRRQRVDNFTLSNAPMMLATTGSGIKEDEPIIPGRWLLLNNISEVQTLEIGRAIDTSMPHEQTAITYAQRRTGVNDYVTGEFSPAMGYSTASVGVQNLRESAKRFDQTMREIRVALGETGTRVVELYQQYNQHGKEYLVMGDKDGAMVHAALQFPLDMIKACVGVEITASSAAFNKEVEIRTNTIIAQMLNQFYTQSIQAMGYVLNPQIPQPIREMAWLMVNGGAVLLRRILDNYGMQDADRLVPEMEALLQNGQQQLNSVNQLAIGGPTGPGGMLPVGGMANLPIGSGGAQGQGMAGIGGGAGRSLGFA